MLIINADDWGRSSEDTDAALACFRRERITSVTAMVFMRDSDRAARIASEYSIPVGLHLNLSEQYDGAVVPNAVSQSHRAVVRLFGASKYSMLVYYPFLHKRLVSVFLDQLAEFRRLYGCEPTHIDGHQHKHLNLNMLFRTVIPLGVKVRRGFSFFPGEKAILNRKYRAAVDYMLARKYRITDYFFALSQYMEITRLNRVLSLSEVGNVELMTHPRFPTELSFLMSGSYEACVARVARGSYERL